MRKGALLAAACVLAIVAVGPAQAQDAPPAPPKPAVTQSRSRVVLLAQTFDGSVTRSLNRTAGVAEARRGAERWIVVDYGSGAVVERGNGQIAGADVVSDSGIELGLVFDPETRAVSGDGFMADILNRHIRPLLDRIPPGAAQWTLRFGPEEAGIAGDFSGALVVRFSRLAISHEGRSLMLLRYEIPGFALGGKAGSIAQWGSGGVLVDAGDGTVLWSGSHHRAVAQQEQGPARPYRAQFSTIAVDAAGAPLVDPAEIGALASLLEQIDGAEADAPLPFAGDAEGAVPQLPLHLAAIIDLLAVGAASEGIDAHGAAFAGFVLGRTGASRAVTPEASGEEGE